MHVSVAEDWGLVGDEAASTAGENAPACRKWVGQKGEEAIDLVFQF